MHYFISIKKHESFYDYTVSAHFMSLRTLQHTFYHFFDNSTCKISALFTQIFLADMEIFNYNVLDEFLIIFNLLYRINNDS